jgi:cell division protein ZapA (FtsZ GTPase activity inhibitor)
MSSKETPLSSIELVIGSQKYLLRAAESEDHLREVAELVRRKVEAHRKAVPSLSLQKAAILAAFDFASQSIKGKRVASDYRAQLMDKAGKLLEQVEQAIQSEESRS